MSKPEMFGHLLWHKGASSWEAYLKEGILSDQSVALEVSQVQDRITRCDRQGTSAVDSTAEEIVAGNRAGPDESTLDIPDLIEYLKERRQESPQDFEFLINLTERWENFPQEYMRSLCV